MTMKRTDARQETMNIRHVWTAPRLMRVVANLSMCAALGPSLGAQIINPAPHIEGQWAGPWDLSATVLQPLDPPGEPAYAPTIWDIAHALVLPPDAPGTPSPAYAGKVLFITERKEFGPGNYGNDQPTHVWDPNSPAVVGEHVMVGNDTLTDIFCSGTTFLGDGNAITVGGVNRAVAGDPFGHDQSYILRTDLPSGILQWEEVIEPAPTLRYYPTALTDATGGAIAIGHSSEPPGASESRDTYTYTPIVLWDSRDNIPEPEPPATCLDVLPANIVLDYPRVHLLRAGELMWENAEARPAPLDNKWYQLSRFLRLEGQQDCSDDQTNPYRWRDGLLNLMSIDPAWLPDASNQVHSRLSGGNSVYLITREDEDLAAVTDVVYLIGGTEHGHDDQSYPCLMNDDMRATDLVFRMRNPSSSSSWEGGEPTPAPKRLNFSRMNSNAVVLLDGSILVVGGSDGPESLDDDCDPLLLQNRTRPERYKPPEVFENLTNPPWTKMAVETGVRVYHSVAGLLPDGRVFAAGGRDEGNERTVELYSPHYFFRGARPEILTAITTVQLYNSPLQLEVTLRGGGENASIERVALIRQGAITHAFDMNQRYVELAFTLPVQVPGTPKWQFDVQLPTDDIPNNIFGRDEAPPGWYMLTVVADMDNGIVPHEDLPSTAKWLLLQ